jgi:hypothetical protein
VTDRLYLRPGAEILQGDIYEQMPSTHVQSRPLRVARCQQGPGGRDRWDVHLETARVQMAASGGGPTRAEKQGCSSAHTSARRWCSRMIARLKTIQSECWR